LLFSLVFLLFFCDSGDVGWVNISTVGTYEGAPPTRVHRIRLRGVSAAPRYVHVNGALIDTTAKNAKGCNSYDDEVSSRLPCVRVVEPAHHVDGLGSMLADLGPALAISAGSHVYNTDVNVRVEF